MIKLFSLFSGIGAFEKALERMKIPYELVGFSEIDKFAIKSYCAIHNVSEDKNFGDITKIDISKLPDFDLMTWGFPCQDISTIGEKKGLSGTRSSLIKEVFRLLESSDVEWVVIENVTNMLHLHKGETIKTIVDGLEKLGYKWAYRTAISNMLWSFRTIIAGTIT